MDAGERVVIVGGGIAGLAAAHYLTRHAPHVRTILVEGEPRPGGKIVTERVDGFVIEGGPDSFLTSKPRGIGLATELGMESRLQGTNESARRTYVSFERELYPLPEGLSGLVPSRLEPLLESQLFSEAGKRRLREEPSVEPRPPDGDESLASFVERRFGREVYDRMIEPLMAGIYGGSGEELSLEATFPQLRRMELESGSLIAAMEAVQREREVRAPARPAFLTPLSGMRELVESIERRLPAGTLCVGTRARGITPCPGGYRVELDGEVSVDAVAVIVATPAYAAGSLLEAIDGPLAETLAAIPHVSSATVSLAYPAEAVPRPLDGYGYIVPRREGRPVLACTWTSTKFAHRAPEGHSLIRVFLGGAGREGVLAGSDADLLEAARGEARAMLRVTCAPILQRVFRWPSGMPQYTLGHLDRVARIEGRIGGHPGLYLAGNAYHGVGIPDCIAGGESAARLAVEHLARQPAGER